LSDYEIAETTPSTEGQQGQQQRAPEQKGGTPYWNPQVKADQHADELFNPDPKAAEDEGQGITSALIVPTRGIFKGNSAFVETGDGSANDMIVREKSPNMSHYSATMGSKGIPNLRWVSLPSFAKHCSMPTGTRKLMRHP
jgi:hypothetical protein